METEVLSLLSSLGFPILVAVFIGFAAVSGVVNFRRCQAITNVADELGLEFEPHGDQELLSRLCGSDLMRGKLRRGVTNLLVAEADGVKFRIFDFQCNNGKPASQIAGGWRTQERPGFSTSQTALLIESMDFSCPRFVVNEQQRDNAPISHDFETELADILARHRDITVEGFESWILIYRLKQRQPPHEYQTLLGLGHEVFQLVGNHYQTQES